ncbi:Holliday junction resolvase RuvX [Candidatus Daviesbacteria bacterium]|nr:Holliday junction resolvase RuvX [Candidatus Daviesbacteria bacterium]
MKYLGVDFGLKRVGLAISEGEIASAWKVIEVKNLKDAIQKVSEIIKKESFEKVVVGLPEGRIGKTAQGFINDFKKQGLLAEAADETLSSKKATAAMIDLNIPRQKRKINDAYSAMLILQNYLDSNR